MNGMGNNNYKYHLHLLNSETDVEWIKVFVCFVSGIAFLQKKEYIIESIKLEGEFSFNFCDNYVVDEKQFKKKYKILKKYGPQKEFETLINLPAELERISKSNALKMNRIRRVIQESGLELNETITRTVENSGPYRANIDLSFDQHSFTIVEKTISPKAFQATFQKVYEKYNQLKHREEIQVISSHLCQPVIKSNQSYVKQLYFLFELTSYNCELEVMRHYYKTPDQSLIDSSSFMFNSLGMAPLPEWNNDFVTFAAAGIAIIEKIIINTKRNGKTVLDIMSIQEDKDCKECVHGNWRRKTFSIPLRYLINNYDDYYKTLKQW